MSLTCFCLSAYVFHNSLVAFPEKKKIYMHTYINGNDCTVPASITSLLGRTIKDTIKEVTNQLDIVVVIVVVLEKGSGDRYSNPKGLRIMTNVNG